jgi:hypothetical protein
VSLIAVVVVGGALVGELERELIDLCFVRLATLATCELP